MERYHIYKLGKASSKPCPSFSDFTSFEYLCIGILFVFWKNTITQKLNVEVGRSLVIADFYSHLNH